MLRALDRSTEHDGALMRFACRQVPVAAAFPHPAHRDRLIDRIAGTAETNIPSDT
jgi:hypothetical protein